LKMFPNAIILDLWPKNPRIEEILDQKHAKNQNFQITDQKFLPYSWEIDSLVLKSKFQSSRNKCGEKIGHRQTDGRMHDRTKSIEHILKFARNFTYFLGSNNWKVNTRPSSATAFF